MPTYTEQKFRKFKESYFRLLTRKNLEDKSHEVERKISYGGPRRRKRP